MSIEITQKTMYNITVIKNNTFQYKGEPNNVCY